MFQLGAGWALEETLLPLRKSGGDSSKPGMSELYTKQ